jgi:hypothetical protein
MPQPHKETIGEKASLKGNARIKGARYSGPVKVAGRGIEL